MGILFVRYNSMQAEIYHIEKIQLSEALMTRLRSKLILAINAMLLYIDFDHERNLFIAHTVHTVTVQFRTLITIVGCYEIYCIEHLDT